MLTRPGSGRDTMIPVLLLGCVDMHSRCPSVGFAHSCSLAAVVCGSHRGYPARHPEVFPYSAGNDPAVAGEEPAEAEDEFGRAAPEPARVGSRRRMPSRASHPANPQAHSCYLISGC